MDLARPAGAVLAAQHGAGADDDRLTTVSTEMAALLAIGVAAAVVAGLRSGRGRRRYSVGPGAAGALYDMMHADKRRAVEIVVKGDAARIDGERGEDDRPPDAPPWATASERIQPSAPRPDDR